MKKLLVIGVAVVAVLGALFYEIATPGSALRGTRHRQRTVRQPVDQRDAGAVARAADSRVGAAVAGVPVR